MNRERDTKRRKSILTTLAVDGACTVLAQRCEALESAHFIAASRRRARADLDWLTEPGPHPVERRPGAVHRVGATSPRSGRSFRGKRDGGQASEDNTPDGNDDRACALAVAGLSKSVKGMEELEAFWLEHQTPHTRAVVDLMLSEIQRFHRALAKEMKEQGYGTPT